MVDGIIGNDHTGACRGRIHILYGCFRIGGAALVDVVEDYGGGHGAGDVHTVEDQRHHCVRIIHRVLSQVHGDLPGGQTAAERISAGLGDVYDRVGRRFTGIMLVGGGAFPVGEALSGFVVHDVVGRVDRGRLIGRGCFSVYGDPAVG